MSSTMTPRFRTISLFALAGAAVLVFHSAAHAQQKKSGAKEADKPKAEAQAAEQPKAEEQAVDQPKAEKKAADQPEAESVEPTKPEVAAEPEAKPSPPLEDLPSEYGPPPGYRQKAPPPRGYPPQGYGPHYDYYYGPPPYPPPRHYRQRPYRPYRPGPFRYYPEPIAYRSFFFGLGLGVGGVAFFPESGMGENSSRAGMAYNLHFGFGVSPHWSIVLSGDGAFAYFNGYDLSQSVWSIGPQVFINRHLYVRAGLGVATKSVDNSASWDYYYDTYESFSDSGMGWTLALGYEFMQSYHTSLGLELGATFGRYKDPDPITYSRNQGTFGINFMLNLF
jgi:hypothetical protein